MLTKLLDLNRPVAVLMLSVLHCVPDDDQVRGAVGRFRDALAPDSHLAISHITRPAESSTYRQAAEEGARTYQDLGVNTDMTFRDREQITGLLDGLEEFLAWEYAILHPPPSGAGRTEATVDFDRPPARHLAFGAGPHRCLGAHLARLELQIALREWHARIPDYGIAPGAQPLEHAGLVLGLDTLPLTW